MDSKDYKDIIAADPSAPFDDSELSADERARVAAFRDEMQALDAKIKAALSVPIPELDLPALPPIDGSKEAGANVVDLPLRNKPRLTTPVWLGIAASFAIAAVLGVRFLGDQTVYPSLAAEVVAHLDHEPYALTVTDTPVAEHRLVKVVGRSGAEIDTDVGLITYARSCVINGKTIPHLVMQGKRGPITLLLMPDEMIDGAVPLSGKSINGVILPVGDGSIAIIGEREENLSEIEQRVVDSVTWRI